MPHPWVHIRSANDSRTGNRVEKVRNVLEVSAAIRHEQLERMKYQRQNTSIDKDKHIHLEMYSPLFVARKRGHFDSDRNFRAVLKVGIKRPKKSHVELLF